MGDTCIGHWTFTKYVELLLFLPVLHVFGLITIIYLVFHVFTVNTGHQLPNTDIVMGTSYRVEIFTCTIQWIQVPTCSIKYRKSGIYIQLPNIIGAVFRCVNNPVLHCFIGLKYFRKVPKLFIS
jgi:hypothetical protein